MASVKDLARLFQAISARDLACAENVASKIVVTEERKGHRSAAQILRGSLAPNGRKGFATHAEVSTQADCASVLSHGLTLLDHNISLSQVTLRIDWKKELQTVIKEWHNRARLLGRGIRRRSKLLFYGPPGCGKSLTGRALGTELALPTYVVRFDAIIGAYLGQTAIHLRELFRFAENTPCILLFDEVDALGKKRGNPLDVGELDRIVISLMQELEYCNVQGLIIATSNLPAHLDQALWRRFDLLIEFPKPTKKELRSYAIKLAKTSHTQLTRRLLSRITTAQSYAQAEQLVEDEARCAALRDL